MANPITNPRQRRTDRQTNPESSDTKILEVMDRFDVSKQRAKEMLEGSNL